MMRVPNAANRPRWRPRRREPEPHERFQQRFLLLKALILVLFGVLVFQLARMQLVDHEAYSTRAESNRLRMIPELPARGLIYDRNGEQLVENLPIFSAAVVPADVPDEQLLTVVAELSRLTGAAPKEIAEAIGKAKESDDPYTPIVVQEDLDEATAFRLRERQASVPGVQVLVESVRNYPAGSLASHYLSTGSCATAATC
jgi:penicillin-binding protein 2